MTSVKCDHNFVFNLILLKKRIFQRRSLKQTKMSLKLKKLNFNLIALIWAALDGRKYFAEVLINYDSI